MGWFLEAWVYPGVGAVIPAEVAAWKSFNASGPGMGDA